MNNIKVSNMRTNGGNYSPNQFIIRDYGENYNYSAFQSYDSMIAHVDYFNKVITIGRDYDYSRTTGKYRNEFFDSIRFYELNNLTKLREALKDGNVTIGSTEYTIKLAA